MELYRNTSKFGKHVQDALDDLEKLFESKESMLAHFKYEGNFHRNLRDIRTNTIEDESQELGVDLRDYTGDFDYPRVKFDRIEDYIDRPWDEWKSLRLRIIKLLRRTVSFIKHNEGYVRLRIKPRLRKIDDYPELFECQPFCQGSKLEPNIEIGRILRNDLKAFDLFCTNSGATIYVQQIIDLILEGSVMNKYGYKYYRELDHLHHLNGNKRDNNYNNITRTSKDVNILMDYFIEGKLVLGFNHPLVNDPEFQRVLKKTIVAISNTYRDVVYYKKVNKATSIYEFILVYSKKAQLAKDLVEMDNHSDDIKFVESERYSQLKARIKETEATYEVFGKNTRDYDELKKLYDEFAKFKKVSMFTPSTFKKFCPPSRILINGRLSLEIWEAYYNEFLMTSPTKALMKAKQKHRLEINEYINRPYRIIKKDLLLTDEKGYDCHEQMTFVENESMEPKK